MNIRAVIAQIVSELVYYPPGSGDEPQAVYFGYGTKYDVNINADSNPFPAVYLLETDSGSMRTKNVSGNVTDRPNTFLQFLNIAGTGEIGQQADYRYDTVEEMKSLLAQFLYRLSNSDQWEDLPESTNYFIVKDYYDVNVTGVEINLAQLTPIQPIQICI